MKIRNEWMTDEIYFGEEYPNNILIQDATRRYEIQRDQSLDGRDAEIDGVSQRIVVQDHTNIVGQRYDKKIHCNVDSNVSMGSVVKFDNKLWLVIGKIFENPAYKTTGVMECNNMINGIPVVIESQAKLHSMGIWDEKYFPVTDSNIILMMPNNDESKFMERNGICKLTEDDSYRIVDLNKVIMPGIVVAKLEWVVSYSSPPPPSPADPEPGYAIDGAGEIKVGQTAIYTATKYVEEIIYHPPVEEEDEGTTETIIVEDETAKFAFKVMADDVPDSAYTLKGDGNKSCKISCNNFPYVITIQAEDEDTGETVDMQVRLISFL